MRVGMAEGQFFLEYQPIVEIKTGRIVCCEALMRWNHPTKRMSPDKFIAVAEETGMILELGRWAINRACEDAVAWPDSVSVAVNLSPVQFKRGNLIETVKAALRNSGLDARRLDLEITESLLITQDAATRRIVDGVVDMGCSLSLDDFGTGYSTFGYLISFPFKKVKLDKGFIEHLKTRPEHRAIIRAVGQMARDMSMSIVAEGVENLSQFEILEAEKVHYAQGWLFSRSVVSAEIPWKKFDKMISGAVNSDVSRAA
jgi:EAL domain-containing protein (putative c-di-GMP-specific phosphodiesterase class I)